MAFAGRELSRLAVLIAALFTFCSTYCDAGIRNSKHDFLYKNKDAEELCVLCHVPHTKKAQQALWMKPEKNTVFFVIPKNGNLLCLSCHDGILAKNIGTIAEPSRDDKKPPLYDVPKLNMYYNSGGTRFSNTCEKHYNILSAQFPHMGIRCTTCHDVHHLSSLGRNGLIKKGIYKSEACRNCHK